VTLIDVAELAQVHVGTASRALDPDRAHLVTPSTRERVRAAAEELGYRVNAVARSLRKGSSGLLGVVVADVGNPFLPPMLRGIEQEVRDEGLLLLIAETHDDPESLQTILEHLATRRVDAIILSAARQGDVETVLAAAALMPVVLAVRSLGDRPSLPTVTHDDELGGRLATEHLVSLGHRTLAQLRGPADVSSFAGRSAGHLAVMAESGAMDVTGPDVAVAPTSAEGYRLTRSLLAEAVRQPTAIFAHNDLMALGCVDALADHGLECPRDVSVVGYNDAPLTDHVSPPLTTVRLPSHELGRRAARLALSGLRGEENPPELTALSPQLVVRASTAAPRAQDLGDPPSILRRV
jgi:LacI family transcriptional regulator